jgi:predicted transcriptional regulator
MISKNDVYNVLLELYKSSQKPVTLTQIKKVIGIDSKEISKALEDLENEGKVRGLSLGRGKAYEPIIDPLNLILELLKSLKEDLRKLGEYFSEKNVNIKLFEEIYEKVKDSLGYAPLSQIRIELGLSKEEFYSKYRSYIEENYELIAGGDEGFIRKGVLYGIIKKRAK